MKHVLIFLVAFISNSCIAQQKSTNQSYAKEVWKVIDIYDGHVVAINKDEAKGMIGKKLLLSDSMYSFNKKDFYYPKITLRKVSTKEYFPIFRRYADEVGISSDSLIIIGIDNKENQTHDELIKIGDSLIYYDDGWFFFLKMDENKP